MSVPSDHAIPEIEAPASSNTSNFVSPEQSADLNDTSLPLYRRIGRHALQALRPLAAPFLHRLDLRSRFSVDHSETAHAVREVHERLEHQILPHVIDTLPGQMASLGSQMTSLGSQMVAMAEVARQTQELVAAQSVAMTRIEGRLSQIDGLRAVIAGTEARLKEIFALRSDTISKLGERSELLVRYAELLLQRNVIPLGQDFAVRTDAGYLMLPSEDPALLISAVESRGRLEPGTLSVVLALLPEGGLLVDVGANVGTFTLPAARKVGPRGKVVALEPAPRIAALLRQTIALNDLTTVVEVHACAAGEVARSAELGLSALTSHNSFWPTDDTVEMINVAVRSLDTMLADTMLAPDSRVDVVKIDVEGAELQVWRGMQEIVLRNPDIALVLEFGPEHLHRAGVSVEDWFAELTASGLSAWEIDEATALVRPLRSAGLADVFSLNILLIRGRPEDRGLRTI